MPYHHDDVESNKRVNYRVFAAITFGGQALGRASALTPDVGKAKMAAAKLFQLFDRKPVPDSSDPDGLQPVSAAL